MYFYSWNYDLTSPQLVKSIALSCLLFLSIKYAGKDLLLKSTKPINNLETSPILNIFII